MNEPVLVHNGVIDPGQLDPQRPIVYQSIDEFSQQDPQGRRPLDNLPLSKEIISKLRKFSGKFTFGQPARNKRSKTVNFHLYSSDARASDGLNRLCYAQCNDKELRIIEYYSARGAHYSALYPLLSERLIAAGFSPKKALFTIERKDIDQFISIANQLLADKSKGLFLLQPKLEADSIKISKNTYYYYKAYWSDVLPIPESQLSRPADDQESSTEILPTNQDGVPEKIRKIKGLIFDIACTSQACQNPQQLQEFDELIQSLHTDISTCSDAIQSFLTGVQQVQALAQQDM